MYTEFYINTEMNNTIPGLNVSLYSCEQLSRKSQPSAVQYVQPAYRLLKRSRWLHVGTEYRINVSV